MLLKLAHYLPATGLVLHNCSIGILFLMGRLNHMLFLTEEKVHCPSSSKWVTRASLVLCFKTEALSKRRECFREDIGLKENLVQLQSDTLWPKWFEVASVSHSRMPWKLAGHEKRPGLKAEGIEYCHLVGARQILGGSHVSAALSSVEERGRKAGRKEGKNYFFCSNILEKGCATNKWRWQH